MNYLSCSIVCYKTSKEMLERAVSSFLNTELNIKLYIVDNSPTDEARFWFKDDRIEYIYNNANIGFGSAHNVAIRKSLNESKYHLVLNPDVYFGKGSLEEICSFMEKNEDVGLLMPKVLYPDGTLQYMCKLLPTPLDFFLRKFLPFEKLLKKINDRFELRSSGYDKIMDVPFLSGCFLFLRNDVLKKAGLFDEKFFMYVEDVDLCRRVYKFSRTVYYPDVSIYHEYSAGSPKSYKLRLYGIDSSIKYFNKWGWFFDKERNRINKKIIESLL